MLNRCDIRNVLDRKEYLRIMNSKKVEKINIILEKFMDLISYSGKRKRALASYHKEYNRYMAMANDEFDTEYIETVATYEHKKLMTSVVFIVLVISAVTNIWSFFFELLTKLLISGQTENQYFIQAAEYLSWFIIILTFVVAAIIVYSLSNSLYKLNKSRILLEKVYKVRERNT